MKKQTAKKKTVKKKATEKSATKKPNKKTPQLSLQGFLAEVRQRAYELFLQRGATHGSDLGDWLKAEKEIKRKYGIK